MQIFLFVIFVIEYLFRLAFLVCLVRLKVLRLNICLYATYNATTCISFTSQVTIKIILFSLGLHGSRFRSERSNQTFLLVS